MASQQHFLGLVDARRETRRPPVVGMKFLHERSMSAGHLFARGGLRKPQDLISFILAHFSRGARSRVALTAPRVSCKIVCRTPAGKTPVEVRFK